ncbi:MAG: AAA family ATPase [Geitlerinemataceae cyanobacterium]
MLNLLHYQETETLYTGLRTLVFRALHQRDRKPFIVKVLRNSHPSFSELVAFRNQYVITQHLDSPLIVKPLGLERCGNGYALVMPDEGAVSLASYWYSADRGMGELLEIAIQLAEALHVLAGQQIIHKDIKPANILIHARTKQIQLIDFSIASWLPKEQQQFVNPAGLEGTLAYLSPEQTGRMNRGLDYRTDFYALGVTLYELLTGTLPFEASDPLELIHCHIAQAPIAPIERSDRQHRVCPEMLSAIVMRLMAKNAEERYQSARGLKHDLERCLEQWRATGIIEPFSLGERDITGRFSIPEKLYGRDTEVQTLLEVFERAAAGSTEMMLVSGFSGIGKTAVVNEVHKPIVRQRGYFIKGKFDQFQRNIPFSAFVRAFGDLVEQLLSESDAELAHWKGRILAAVGDNCQVIIEVLPELESIVGPQPPVLELSGSAAQNRFNLVFQKFIQAFTTQDRPLVIFIDDLQWADAASLKLLQLLNTERDTGYLLLLGAYRNNEVSPAHPLMLTLKEIGKSGVEFDTITLAPLDADTLNFLVAETLSCPQDVARPLSEAIARKTQGNPFFATQFLQGLYDDGSIVFDRDLGQWQCDLTQVQQSALTEDVVEFMAGRLCKLPDATQEIAKLAACIGNQFDLKTLATVSERDPVEVASALWEALKEGLVLPLSETYKFFQGEASTAEASADEQISVAYRFLHDRVQQAAYSLIPAAQKQAVHYRIGRLLLDGTSPEHREEHIFELVGQLNGGIQSLTQPEERTELAQLNLLAGQKAKRTTAYQSGWEYVQTGLSLLGENPWQHQYETILAFSELAVEFAALCGDWAEMDRFVDEVVAHSRSLIEQANVYRIQIKANISRHRLAEATEIAFEFLKRLGITFPEEPSEADMAGAIAQVQASIGDRQVEDLLLLPEMQDPEKIAILQITQSIFSATHISKPHFFPLVVSFAASLSIEYGNMPSSSFAYACYGLLLSAGSTPDVATGVKFAQLSLQLLDKFAAKIAEPEVLLLAGLFLMHRTSPVRGTLPLLQAGYTSGLETGNYEFVGYNAHSFCSNSFWCGEPLEALSAEARSYCHHLELINQSTAAGYIQAIEQMVLNLLERSEDPTLLAGEVLQEAEAVPQWQNANDLQALYIFHSYKLMLCFLFGEIEATRTHIAEGRKCFLAATGMVNVPASHFYGALSAIAEIDTEPDADLEYRTERLDRVRDDLEILKHWAEHAPMNHQHKVDLVMAETSRVGGDRLAAIELYDRAIAGASANRYIQEEALANELFAKFYLAWGRPKEAGLYMQEAYYGYARWGAIAKASHLEANYADLLAPILQKQTAAKGVDPLELLDQTLSAVQGTGTSHANSRSGLSTALDVATILQAAQKLTRTIELETLLGEIGEIVLTSSGAQKVVLLTPQDSSWHIQTIAEIAGGEVTTDSRSQPLTSDSPVPIRLIQYVKNTQTSVSIDEAKTELAGILEGYFPQYQPQSVLCVPLLNQGNLVAIAYLEHPTTKGVFTPNCQTIVEFLCAQAAVALQNAQLYRRTQHALTDLQQAQLQLVQSEKMSVLGNLVSGIAHEINNPVGFLQGNIQPAQDYVRDLLGLIDLYQEEVPEPSEAIEDEIEAIDLDFIREDLPNLIGSMNTGIDRIRNISTSLRTFSRTDRESKTAFNIHDGLDSTLLILKHRTKANEERPAIEIVKQYGELPGIHCFPGQLNQVFMNLLANAIDALDEGNSGKTYQGIEQNPNRIAIQTSIASDRVQIQIQDNGCGMKPETVARIFEQGFTTKEVGKGTGLGMAIAHQIVTEKHGGTLTCQSELGQGTTFTIALPLSS